MNDAVIEMGGKMRGFCIGSNAPYTEFETC